MPEALAASCGFAALDQGLALGAIQGRAVNDDGIGLFPAFA
jgi:hypothetical protein